VFEPIDVFKGYTTVLQVHLGIDVSEDEFKSQIRVNSDRTSDLIAEWEVSFATDGTDGELILTLDDSVTGVITHTTGYMDLVRISAGEPLPVFKDVLEVLFKDTVTV
jgi:dihydrodipicolinate reductase